MLFEPYKRFHSSGNSVAVYWKTAAHSATDIFSKYKYRFVNLIFSTSVF